MNKIVEKKHFSEKVVQLVVEAPLIARSRRAGHFVIVRADEHGERIPLTIADSDTTAGTITLVVQAVGKSTKKICDKAVGDSLHDVVGPLGQATKIEKVGTVVCCGGGVGVAPLLPIIRAMKQAGNRVVSVLAGRTKDLIILEDEVRRLLPWRNENALNTVGYKEMFAYIDGVWSFDEAVERIKGNTRRYARKQLTWFKRDPAVRWFDADDNKEIMTYISQEWSRIQKTTEVR